MSTIVPQALAAQLQALAAQLAPPPLPPPPNPPATGAWTIVPGQSGTDGGGNVWSFGTPTNSSGNQLLINGMPAADGFAVLLEYKGASVYAKTKGNAWYVWTGSSWKGSPAP